MLTRLHKDIAKKERPVRDLCPLLDLVTEDLVLSQDGSLMAAFKYEGLNPNNVDDELANRTNEKLQHARSRGVRC